MAIVRARTISDGDRTLRLPGPGELRATRVAWRLLAHRAPGCRGCGTALIRKRGHVTLTGAEWRAAALLLPYVLPHARAGQRPRSVHHPRPYTLRRLEALRTLLTSVARVVHSVYAQTISAGDCELLRQRIGAYFTSLVAAFGDEDGVGQVLANRDFPVAGRPDVLAAGLLSPRSEDSSGHDSPALPHDASGGAGGAGDSGAEGGGGSGDVGCGDDDSSDSADESEAPPGAPVPGRTFTRRVKGGRCSKVGRWLCAHVCAAA